MFQKRELSPTTIKVSAVMHTNEKRNEQRFGEAFITYKINNSLQLL